MNVTAGYHSSLFLDDNCNAWGCKANQFSSQNDLFEKVEDAENICSVDSGFAHHLFLDPDGNVFRFDSEKNNRPSIVQEDRATTKATNMLISGLPKINSVAASFNRHSLFLDEENHVWACGANKFGELGFGEIWTSNPGAVPVKLPIMRPIKSITAGWKHSVFLDEEGAPWGCGNNTCGELGLGDTKFIHTAEKIANLPSIKEIFAGCQHTMFLGEDGSVWGTGLNANGELGYAKTQQDYVARPKKIEELPEIKTIAAGWNHSLFLDFSGGIWVCGSNMNNQLGIDSVAQVKKPTRLPELPEMHMIAAGGIHSLFVDLENSLWACGSKQSAESGNSAVPRMVENGEDVF